MFDCMKNAIRWIILSEKYISGLTSLKWNHVSQWLMTVHKEWVQCFNPLNRSFQDIKSFFESAFSCLRHFLTRVTLLVTCFKFIRSVTCLKDKTLRQANHWTLALCERLISFTRFTMFTLRLHILKLKISNISESSLTWR